MKSEKIIIANLKCSGCANTITKNISEINGVFHVEVNNEEDSVTINYEGDVKRETFTKALHDLGYPEATKENGLLLQLKSYAQNMVGKFGKKTDETA